MNNSFTISGVKFHRTTPNTVRKVHSLNMLFFMISQSGSLDRRGTIYFFTPTGAYFMEREDYTAEFKDELFILIIRPDIYDSFIHELCAKTIRDFWFDTAIEVYENKYCE